MVVSDSTDHSSSLRGVAEMALNRVLVGVDGSVASLSALSWAVGLSDSCQVTAGYAFAPDYSEVSHQQHEALRAEAENSSPAGALLLRVLAASDRW